MTDNVIPFTGATTGRIDPEVILDAASKLKFEDMMVLGWTEEGMLYIAASTGYMPDNIALLEVAKAEMLSFYLSE